LKKPADIMLEEFISSDEFREKSGMSESQIAAIVLNVDATNLLANGVRALVKEFCKDQDNQLKIIKSIKQEVAKEASRTKE
jgi:hypothetical protein